MSKYESRSVADCSYALPDLQEIPYIHPDCTNELYSLYLFLKEPPPGHSWEMHRTTGTIDPVDSDLYAHYYPWLTQWAADVHLIGTYVFLDNDEVRQFATGCQSYLIKEVHEQTVYDLVGQQYTPIRSVGLVASWMWFFQRTDVNKRNEWSNYSNWSYLKGPLRAKFNGTYLYLRYLQEKLIEAKSLENMRVTHPTEFVILYVLFIIVPMSLGDTPLISPFHPPSMYSFGIAGLSTAEGLALGAAFDEVVHYVSGRLEQVVEMWYRATSGINGNSPTPEILSAPIASPWPLSTWCTLKADDTEPFNEAYSCGWDRPDIYAKGGGYLSTTGLGSSPIATLAMIPTVESSLVSMFPPFTDLPATRWDLSGCCGAPTATPPDLGEPHLGNCTNPIIPVIADLSGWVGGASALPYCPMVCPSNNIIGAGGGWCACYNHLGPILVLYMPLYPRKVLQFGRLGHHLPSLPPHVMCRRTPALLDQVAMAPNFGVKILMQAVHIWRC